MLQFRGVPASSSPPVPRPSQLPRVDEFNVSLSMDCFDHVAVPRRASLRHTFACCLPTGGYPQEPAPSQ
eukprot:8991378-Prorocentrum_lima.AAC.1